MGTLRTWTGAGSATNTNWDNANNWNTGVPAHGDGVAFTAGCAVNCAINVNTNNLDSFDMTGYNGLLTGSGAINFVPLTNTIKSCTFSPCGHTWTGGFNWTGAANSTGLVTWPTVTIKSYCYYYGNAGHLFYLNPCLGATDRSFTWYTGTVHFDGLTGTSGFVHTTGAWSLTDNGVRTLDWGNATLDVLTEFRIENLGNTTITFGPSAKLIVRGNNNWPGRPKIAPARVSGTAPTLPDIEFYSNNTGATLVNPGIIDGKFTCRNLTIVGPASYNGTVAIGQTPDSTNASIANATINITGTLAVSGNSATNRLHLKSNVYGQKRTFTVVGSSVVMNGVDLQDIEFISASTVNISGGSFYSGDCGGNSCTGGGSLIFTPGVTRTCTGTSFSWVTTPARWTGGIVPLPQDNVIVSLNAGATLSANTARLGRNLSFTSGRIEVNTGADWFYSTVYDSINLTNCELFFNAIYTLNLEERTRTGTFPVTSNGVVIASHITANLSGSVLHFADNLATSGNITINSGTVDASGHNVNINASKYSQLAGALAMGSGEWRMRGTGTPWYINAAVSSLDAGTSTILFTGTTASSTLVFDGGGKTYNNFSFYGKATGTIQVSGNNTFANVTMNSAQREATTIKFPDSGTTTFTSQANGFNNLTSLLTFSNLANTTLVKTGGGVVNCDFLRIPSLCTASPGGTWNIGDNSIANSSGTTVLGWMAPSIGTWFNV